MKKCSRCGSINADDDRSCGVCGRTLSGVVSLDPSQIPAAVTVAENPSRKVNVRGLVGLSIGVGFCVAGFSLIIFFSIFGIELMGLFFSDSIAPFASFSLALSMIGIGYIIITATYDIVTQTPYYAFRSVTRREGARVIRQQFPRVFPTAETVGEVEREEEEMRERETGEAD